MSLSYWIHPSISIFNLVLGLKAKKNKQNVLLGRQFQLFLSSKNAIGDMELSTQCYFLWAPASFWSVDSVTPAFVRLIMSQYRQEASLDPLLPPSLPPTHEPPRHQTRIPFAGRYGCVLQTMSAPPSLWPGWQLLCSGSSMRLTSVSAGLTMI